MGWLSSAFLACTLLFLTGETYAQSLAEEARIPLAAEAPSGAFVETIKIISASRKIFVLTNNNQLLGPGDFVSLALNDQLAARAVVAKTHDGNAGLKILKIYSLAQWSKLRRGGEVQVVRGDDSMFGKKGETKVSTTEEAPRIKSEEDLFNATAIEEGGEIEEDSKRHIKPDNVVSVGLGFTDVEDAEGGEKRGNQFSGAWAYQFQDNWFAEFLYARTLLNDYPVAGMQTAVSNVSLRLKYNFKAPLYSFIMPYAGFRSQSAESPRAGKEGSNRDLQATLVDDLNKSGLVAGVTVLRRLVPGWFLKLDLGTDVLNLGVAIEF